MSSDVVGKHIRDNGTAAGAAPFIVWGGSGTRAPGLRGSAVLLGSTPADYKIVSPATDSTREDYKIVSPATGSTSADYI